MTNLTHGTGVPANRTDFAFAVQWAAVLNGGASLSLTSEADDIASTIPEPGIPLLGALALAGLLVRPGRGNSPFPR